MLAPFQGVAFKLSAGAVVPAPAAIIEVRRKDNGALAAIFNSQTGAAGTEIVNPSAFADANGNFLLYAAGLPQGYLVKVTDGAFSYTLHASIGNAAQLDASDFGAGLMLLDDLAALRALLKSPRLLFTYIGANVANAGGSLEDGITGYTLPAGTLTPGCKLVVESWGFAANNANAKTAQMWIGATDIGGLNLATGEAIDIRLRSTLVPTGVGAQKLSHEALISGTATVGLITSAGVVAIDETIDNVIKTTTDAVAAADFTWQGMTVQFWPAP